MLYDVFNLKATAPLQKENSYGKIDKAFAFITLQN